MSGMLFATLAAASATFIWQNTTVTKAHTPVAASAVISLQKFSVAAPSEFDKESAMTPDELLGRWDPMITAASKRFGVSKDWIRAVMRRETGGRTMLAPDQKIVSPVGAMGLMQVMPETYAEMRSEYGLGADPFNPEDNINAGAAYLRFLKAKYGFPAMLAAYNAGPGRLEQHMNGASALPEETRNYVSSIARYLKLETSSAKFAALLKPVSKRSDDANKVAAAPKAYVDPISATFGIIKQEAAAYGVLKDTAAAYNIDKTQIARDAVAQAIQMAEGTY